MHIIGKIDINIYKCVTEDIQTDEVIITDNQIAHIKERHPDAYEQFSRFFNEILQKPDYIIEANKPDTAIILKEINVGSQKTKTVLKLAASSVSSKLSNSIITFMKIDDKDWNRLLRNKKILYKSE